MSEEGKKHQKNPREFTVTIGGLDKAVNISSMLNYLRGDLFRCIVRETALNMKVTSSGDGVGFLTLNNVTSPNMTGDYRNLLRTFAYYGLSNEYLSINTGALTRSKSDLVVDRQQLAQYGTISLGLTLKGAPADILNSNFILVFTEIDY